MQASATTHCQYQAVGIAPQAKPAPFKYRQPVTGSHYLLLTDGEKDALMCAHTGACARACGVGLGMGQEWREGGVHAGAIVAGPFPESGTWEAIT
jgi:hypothetical protein